MIDDHGRILGNEVPLRGHVEPNAVELRQPGGPQRRGGHALSPDKDLHVGRAGSRVAVLGGFLLLEDDVGFRQPSPVGGAQRQRDGNGYNGQDQHRHAQRRQPAVPQVGQHNGRALQNDAGNARQAEARHKDFDDQQDNAEKKTEENRQVLQ